MSTTIYLLKTHKINLSNLFLLLLLENLKHVSFEACEYTLVNNKFIELKKLGNFAKSVIHDPKNKLRSANWAEYLDLLDQQVTLAQRQNKKIIFGSHSDEQIRFLKNHYNNNIVTISINYNNNLYDKLIQNIAEYHVFQMRNQLTNISELDQHLLATYQDIKLIEHYSTEFDKMNLIPVSNYTEFEHNISIDDFYNLESINNHFNNLGIINSVKSNQLWSQWRSSQTN